MTWVNNMETMETIIWFCHVTGGAYHYDFHGYLSEITIEKYRNLGCKVNRIKWKKVILC